MSAKQDRQRAVCKVLEEHGWRKTFIGPQGKSIRCYKLPGGSKVLVVGPAGGLNFVHENERTGRWVWRKADTQDGRGLFQANQAAVAFDNGRRTARRRLMGF